MHGLVIRYF